MSECPTPESARRLKELYEAASESLPEIRHSHQGYALYPEPINNFMDHLSLSGYARADYVGKPIQEWTATVETASVDQVLVLLTALIRSERFSPNSWESLFRDGTVGRIVNRTVELLCAD